MAGWRGCRICRGWPGPARSSSPRVAVDQPGEVLLGGRADDLLHDLTVLEQAESRNAQDRVASGQSLVLVHVHFSDPGFSLVAHRDAIEDGAHQPARAAPLGPEIDQNRTASL